MRILLKKISNGKDYDITHLLTKYEWGGSVEKGVRSFSFDVINAPYDKNIMELIPPIATGDLISFYTDPDYAVPNYLLFYGQVENMGKKSNKGTISYTCHDMLIHLTRSETNRTYNETAEAIAMSICTEFGLTPMYIVPTGVSIGKTVFEDKTYFDIISEAYKKAGLSTGKNYYMAMDGIGFYTQEEGKTMLPIKISDGTDENKGKGNILSSSFEESMSDLVNRVNVYDSDGKFVTRVEDAESITKYGLFEVNYTVENDVDINAGANKQLKQIETIIKFEVIGEVNYISGRSVMVHDTATGLDGEFLIVNDSHIWQKGEYITTLNLKFMGLAPTEQKILFQRS